MAEKVEKEAGRVILTNATTVNMRFIKRNSGIMAVGEKNKHAIALLALKQTSVSKDDLVWLKKLKVFTGAVDKGFIIVGHSRMPNAMPATRTSEPEPPENLKPKKEKVGKVVVEPINTEGGMLPPEAAEE